MRSAVSPGGSLWVGSPGPGSRPHPHDQLQEAGSCPDPPEAKCQAKDQQEEFPPHPELTPWYLIARSRFS